jgi:outer membrane protein assembly factor BamB
MSRSHSSYFFGKASKTARCTALGAVLLAAAAVLLLCSCGSSQNPLLTGSGEANVNTSNTRYVGGPINSSTVRGLELAWRLPLTARSQYGSYASIPVISHGVIYSQDLDSNVQAIELHTGKVLWTKNYSSPDEGPNGLVVAGGRVYGATPTAAFALNQQTGAQEWLVTLVRNEHEGIDMDPGYHDGIVYLSTVPGNVGQFYTGEGVGILWALDAKTGRRLWHFDTAPEDLWSPGNVAINSGGGVWYSPAFDQQGNMYIGTGNPGPFPGTQQYPWGSSRPGPDLYTDSIVKLNAKTGKLVWYYQQTPHDLYDHDLQDPPILADVGGKQVVLAAGKSGFVLELDAETGKLLWRRSVGIHDGHDNDGIYAMKHEYDKLHLPETVLPGLVGGVIAPMAANGSTVFVPVINSSVTYTTQLQLHESRHPTGELVALNIATGAVRWKTKLSSAAYGAVTAVNDLVFATISTGVVYAFDARTGKQVWEARLPAGTNTGVAVSGDMVIVPAGLITQLGEVPELLALRLQGG